MQAIAIIARYHRGSLAPVTHPMFRGIPVRSRVQILRLAGILRLAVALEDGGQAHEFQPVVSRKDGAIVVAAVGLNARVGPAGEHLARAKYLLETTCKMPIRLENSADVTKTDQAGI